MTRFRADGVLSRESVANGLVVNIRFLFQFVSNFVVGSRTIHSLQPTQKNRHLKMITKSLNKAGSAITPFKSHFSRIKNFLIVIKLWHACLALFLGNSSQRNCGIFAFCRRKEKSVETENE